MILLQNNYQSQLNRYCTSYDYYIIVAKRDVSCRVLGGKFIGKGLLFVLSQGKGLVTGAAAASAIEKIPNTFVGLNEVTNNFIADHLKKSNLEVVSSDSLLAYKIITVVGSVATLYTVVGFIPGLNKLVPGAGGKIKTLLADSKVALDEFSSPFDFGSGSSEFVVLCNRCLLYFARKNLAPILIVIALFGLFFVLFHIYKYFSSLAKMKFIASGDSYNDDRNRFNRRY